jgi:hypothetical protein
MLKGASNMAPTLLEIQLNEAVVGNAMPMAMNMYNRRRAI